MFNRNPSGKNQYGSIREYLESCDTHRANGESAKADDTTLVAALESYHREKLTSNDMISERLKREYNITMRLVSLSHVLCPPCPALNLWG